MLSVSDIINRSVPPPPWSEGDNIPWNEPSFSKRMLAEHLSQDHDLASRRIAHVEAQVASLLSFAVPEPPARVLDLACGPGLYLNRIAAAGHSGVGIDFSPASIEYATTHGDGLAVEYRHDDLRTAAFGSGFATALLLYGQINVFRRMEAESIVARTYESLSPGGVFVVEPQTREHVSSLDEVPSSWSSHASGLFSADPHLLLTETFWDEAESTATQRFFVIDALSGAVARHALSNVAYSEEQLVALLTNAGFDRVELRPSLTGDRKDDGLCALVGFRTA